MFLLVREVTGDARAAFVAGLIYGFVPYRVAQVPHVQVLSSQWMPFALYGLRRYFDYSRGPLHPAHNLAPLAGTPSPRSAPLNSRGSILALVGGSAALVAQNLSCGYFLLFFAPFVILYVVYELADRGRLTDGRAWLALTAAGAAVTAATVPFLLPYLELRRLGIGGRSFEDVLGFSADVYSYLSAAADTRLWGAQLQVFRKSEGELFLGFTAYGLAGLGTMVAARAAWRRVVPDARARAPVASLAVFWLVATLVALAVAVLAQGRVVQLGRLTLILPMLSTMILASAGAAVVLLAVSPAARATVRGVPGSLAGFALGATLLAFWLSLGPYVRSIGRRLGAGPYILI
jgi:hypothetical protein